MQYGLYTQDLLEVKSFWKGMKTLDGSMYEFY